MRPLMLLCTAFLLAIGAVLYYPALIYVVVASAMLYAVAKKNIAVLIPVAVGLLLAVLVSGLYLRRVTNAQSIVGTTLTGNATLLYTGFAQSFMLESAEGETYIIDLGSYAPELRSMDIGETVELVVTVESVERESYEYLVSAGIKLVTSLVSYDTDTAQSEHIYSAFIRMREDVCSTIYSALSSQNTGLMLSLLFSNKDYLDDDIQENFRASGLSHLMSVSGLHISIMMFVLILALKQLKVPVVIRVSLIMFGSMFLFVAAGMSPSIFRSLIMLMFTMSAVALGRQNDSLTVLAFSATILVVICPPILSSISFLLSYLSTLGILLFYKKLVLLFRVLWHSKFINMPKWVRYISSAMIVSFAAQIITLPIIAYQFGNISVLGVFVNLIAIPLCYPILVFGFAGTVFIMLGAVQVARLIFAIPLLCTGLLGLLAQGVAEIPYNTLYIRTFAEFAMLCLVCTTLTILIMISHKHRIAKITTRIMLMLLPITAILLYMYNSNTITLVSSTETGGVLVYNRDGSVFITSATNNYERSSDLALCMDYIGKQPDYLLITDPTLTEKEIDSIASTFEHYTYINNAPYTQPLWNSAYIVLTDKYTTEVWVEDVKIMKYYGSYGTMTGEETTHTQEIMLDRTGRVNVVGIDRLIYNYRGRQVIQFMPE